MLKEGDVIPEMLVKRGRDQRRHHSLMPRIVKEYADDAFSSLSTRLSHFLAQRVGGGGGDWISVYEREFCSKGSSQLVRRQIYTHYRLAARCFAGELQKCAKRKPPKRHEWK